MWGVVDQRDIKEHFTWSVRTSFLYLVLEGGGDIRKEF